MKRVKIRNVDKDVYELYVNNTANSMYVSEAQLRALADDIPLFLEFEFEKDEEFNNENN